MNVTLQYYLWKYLLISVLSGITLGKQETQGEKII
jgi:hypothetical protein